jgi:prepilin-type N-terminal cleavage/methylation domain-containing protein
MRARSAARGGFTLAEVAVTIVIVGIGLVLALQGLNTAKLTAAHTRNLKLARELGLLTLGQIAGGMFQEDIDEGLVGTYADEGYPDFSFEVALGDEGFAPEETDPRRFDNWQAIREQKEEDADEDEEEQEQPFERVKIKIVFPAMRELPGELVLEQWIPWTQVYGEDEDAAPADQAAEGGGNAIDE